MSAQSILVLYSNIFVTYLSAERNSRLLYSYADVYLYAYESTL